MSAANDAIGLAAGSNSKTAGKITYGEKLRRAALSAQDGNLAINAVTSAFTYTISNSGPVDLTQAINAPASVAKFLCIGGAPITNNGSLYLKSGTTLGSGNLGTDNLSRQNQCAYECMVEGPAIAMQIYTAAEFLLNVAAGYTLATMAYLAAGPITVAQSNTLYIRINNPNFDGRPWRARFELGCNGAGLANFWIAPNTKLRPPRDPSPINTLVIGDSMACSGAGGVGFTGSITGNVLTVTGLTTTSTSYIAPGSPLNGTGVAPGQYIVAQTGGTGGGNGTYSLGIAQANQSAATMRSGNAWGHQSWVSRLALMMGWRLWSASLPGTGFVQANGNFQAFKDRVAADLAVVASSMSPDIVIIPVSINDYNQVYTNMQPATVSILTKVRAAFPGVPIIVTGMFPGSYGPNNGCISVENAVNGSGAGLAQYLAASSDANVFSIPLTTETINGSLIFGTGTCGAAVGDGNADSYVCVDRIHLEPGVGERFASQSMANLLAPIIAQI